MEELDSPWQGIDRQSLHRVTDPRQAAILADPTRAQFLRPFLGRERTVSEAAEELGVAANTLLYRVRRMRDAGLLTVVRRIARAGSPIAVYRSSHEGYLVPVDVIPSDDLHHRVRSVSRILADRVADAYADVLAHLGTEGARVLARAPTGDIWSSDLAPRANHRDQPLHLSDATVWLTRAEAEEVRQLLLAASRRAVEAAREGAGPAPRDPYLLVAAVLPTRD